MEQVIRHNHNGIDSEKLEVKNSLVNCPQESVAQASGGLTVDSQARTAINDLIVKLQAVGIINKMDFLNKAKNFITGNIGKIGNAVGSVVAPNATLGVQAISKGVNMLNKPAYQSPVVAPVSQPVVQPQQPMVQQPQVQQPMVQQPSYTAPTPPTTPPTFSIDTSSITSDRLKPSSTYSDVENYRKELEAKYQAYQQAQSPLQQQYVTQSGFSPEYQQAQANIVTDNAGYRQGIQDIMNKPIGMDFQTGQTAALTRDAALKLQANADVANYYEKLRQNNLAGTQAQLGFNTDSFNNQMAVDKQVQDYAQNYASQNKPFTVGEGSSVYNPLTGQIEVTNPKTVATGINGLTTQQANLFNNIVNNFSKSPLIAASDRTIVLKDTIDQIKKDPGNAAQQLNLVYAYIQALDTYQSAVREGELGLVNSIDSKVGQLENWKDKILNGQIVRPEVALQIADAATNIINTIQTGAQNKSKQYQSQANTLGLGDAWSQFTGGYTSSFAGGGNTGSTSGISQTGGLETNW